jgi:hypothetical protein
LETPSGLAFDGAGNLYIADSVGGSIDRVPLHTDGSTYSIGTQDVFVFGFSPGFTYIALLATPEPSSLALLSMAVSVVGGCGWWARRRRRMAALVNA